MMHLRLLAFGWRIVFAILSISIVCSAAFPTNARAGETLDSVITSAQDNEDDRDSYEPTDLEGAFKNWGQIYNCPSNKVIQEFWLLGRYHGQQHWADGSSGTSSAWESRRYRMGFQARVFDKATLHAQMVSFSDFEPFYNGFTELWAQWKFCDQLALSVGQQKHRFTHDRNVSSRYISTLERSQLVNMFRADYTPAVTLQGTINKFSYYTGLFSNATGPDMWRSFTELDSGYSFLTNTYYEITEHLPADSAFLEWAMS